VQPDKDICVSHLQNEGPPRQKR